MSKTDVPSKAREYFLPQLDGIHNLTIREVDVPQPGPTEVLVKVHAVSLNFRDLIIAQGTYPGPKHAGLVPCSDMAGEIVARGAAVTEWAVGDRVAANFTQAHLHGDITRPMLDTALGGSIDGVLTEYRAFPADTLVRVPDYMTYEEASTLPCAAVTAYNALLGPAPLKGGDWVLVQGTGGVSVFALQIAAASGANVIATSSSDAKLALAKKLGAQHLINYKTTPDWEQEVLKITGGRGVDHVIEVGGPGTLTKSLDAVRMAGWVHLIGFLAGAQGDASDVPLKVLFKAAQLRGILIGSRVQFEDMLHLFSAREIHPVVDKVFDFEQAQEAYKLLESQKFIGKVVIKVSKQ
ncbi:NAD(P)-dependent alcohol dehydrogenase [Phanerochaete sordida]|uniref:NAD(P)-dependent alcohol dehydrogenase n=1 Tax=Phanerochaete sordida TaxID=48140 RepID=A0A9P3LBZ1_9APHY|nr:NAD(P)-dependent alcohol dehydrogenase [Phanerochaete sordida]